MELSTTTARIGPAQDQHARPPAIGQRAEAELRHRVRHLEAHRQRAGRGQRQIQVRNQQRQQRRVHVAVGVDDEVRRRHLPDANVQPEPAALTHQIASPQTAPRSIATRLVELGDAKRPGGGRADQQRQTDSAMPRQPQRLQRQRLTGKPPRQQPVGARTPPRHHQSTPAQSRAKLTAIARPSMPPKSPPQQPSAARPR